MRIYEYYQLPLLAISYEGQSLINRPVCGADIH